MIMTIEEKAKRYDKAIEIAKEINNEQRAQPFNVMTRVFPELKESEDERIRKELIAFIKKRDRSGCDYDYDQWLAWLEKQGESDETKAKMFLINKGYPIDANGKFPTYEEMYDIIKKGLEEQSEKPQGKTALEAIKEERVDNANKIEPKDYNSIDPHFGKPIDMAPIVIRDFNSVFSREQVEEIDKRIEKSQRLYNAKLRDAMQKAKDFPMTD